MKIENWQNQNKELLEKIDNFREGYTCKCKCWEWEKWEYCIHLRKAIAKRFEKEIEMQILSLAKINSNLIPVEPSQSLTIS
jgi:hypothetical protein